MKTAFFAFLLSLSAAILCHAQQSRVNLSFVSFPKAFDLKPVELLVGPEKTVQLKLPTHTISRPVRVPQLAEWRLGESSVDENGEFVFKTYGKVKASSSKNQTLIVFRSPGADKPEYEIVRLNGDANGFRGGSQFFYNATKVPIAGKVGDKQFVLQPKQYKLIKANPSFERNGREYLGVEFFYKFKDIEKFDSTTWRYNDKVRYMVFFFHGDKTKQISTHMLRTYPKDPQDLPTLQGGS